MAKTNKWDSIEWLGGIVFPEPYDYQKFKINGVGPFSAELEEMMYHFASKIETDYMTNQYYLKNFKSSIDEILPAEYKKKKFPEDFMEYFKFMKQFIDSKKESKKELTKDEKKAAVATKEKLREENGFIMLNGTKQPIGSFTIEPPGILITRGDDKRIGSWKPRVKPEDIIINATNGKGPKPPAGHKWKKVAENKGALWCAYYYVEVHGFKHLPKKIMFAAHSDVTKDNEQHKYEKARQVIIHWDEIQKKIFKAFDSKDKKEQLTAMVVYLVQVTGCRIGNDKDIEIQSDTVGISTLRKEHIDLTGTTLSLNFFGKDSVEYNNTIEIDPKAALILCDILKTKKAKDEVFAEVSSFDASSFLREVVPETSIKIFRTAYGTKLLCEELQKRDFSKSLTVADKLHIYDLCNLEVAKKLNHKRTPPKNFDEKTEQLTAKLEADEQAAIDLEKKLTFDMRKLLKDIEIAKETFDGEQLQKRLEKFDEKKIKLAARLEKVKTRLATKKTKLEFRTQTKEISIGTSRTAYSSPRIAYSWCKDLDVPIEKIYTKSAIGKMSWAENTPTDYWKKFPNVKAN